MGNSDAERTLTVTARSGTPTTASRRGTNNFIDVLIHDPAGEVDLELGHGELAHKGLLVALPLAIAVPCVITPSPTRRSTTRWATRWTCSTSPFPLEKMSCKQLETCRRRARCADSVAPTPGLAAPANGFCDALVVRARRSSPRLRRRSKQSKTAFKRSWRRWVCHSVVTCPLRRRPLFAPVFALPPFAVLILLTRDSRFSVGGGIATCLRSRGGSGAAAAAAAAVFGIHGLSHGNFRACCFKQTQHHERFSGPWKWSAHRTAFGRPRRPMVCNSLPVLVQTTQRSNA